MAVYERRPGRVVFVHTEVKPEFKGRGLADRLARWALDDVRARGDEKVIARCPFIAGFIGRHPEYGDLLAGRPPLVPPPPVTRD
jgi:predicted GNAT family acetyltransferase